MSRIALLLATPERCSRRIFLATALASVVLLLALPAFARARPRALPPFVSPDGTHVAVVSRATSTKPPGTRIEIRSRSGAPLFAEILSPDNDGDFLRGAWSPDSQFFVFLTRYPAIPQHPVYFYCRRANSIQQLRRFLGDLLTDDFSFRDDHTLVIAVRALPGLPSLAVDLAAIPCHAIATCYLAGAPHRTVPARDYTLREEFDRQTGEHRLYLRRWGETKPRLLFADSRSASACIGPAGRLALVNSFPASKTAEVYAASLESLKSWRIDREAIAVYRQNAKPDPRLIVLPEGRDLSPDDREALLAMDLVHVSAGAGPEAARLGQGFQKWWYVVDSRSGQVLREYRAPWPPSRWWMRAK